MHPRIDPTPIFELFRGIHGTELLTAAVAHFNLFEHLAHGAMPPDALRERLQLAERPFVVLTTALRAMGLLAADSAGALTLTELAREHLVPGSPFDVSGYVSLAAKNPSVLAMVERLRTNLPAGRVAPDGAQEGTAFIYREGVASAMDKEASARELTLSLAGRARNVAPYLAERVPLPRARTLLDVGGGTGIYSYALLQRNPHLRAIILDRPEVLKVAEEVAREFKVIDRVKFLGGDMFTSSYPEGMDAVLLSNILHDWDVPECRRLIRLAAEALAPGGHLIIHDVFLNDSLDGPLPLALYSATLFAMTEGRAYSAGEYREWLNEAGLSAQPIIPTLIHCGALVATG